MLQDKLRLTTAQALAFAACTQAELRALTLAASPADVALAQRQHLLAIGRILSASQLTNYLPLHQQLTESLLTAEAEVLASR